MALFSFLGESWKQMNVMYRRLCQWPALSFMFLVSVFSSLNYLGSRRNLGDGARNDGEKHINFNPGLPLENGYFNFRLE